MNKKPIKRPIDLFVDLECHCLKLQELHTAHYFKMMTVYNICKTSAIISDGTYDEVLLKLFPTNEPLILAVEVINRASQYWKEKQSILAAAKVFIEQAETTGGAKIREGAGKVFSEDKELQEMVSNIKTLSGGILKRFEGIRTVVLAQGKRKSPLLLEPLGQ